MSAAPDGRVARGWRRGRWRISPSRPSSACARRAAAARRRRRCRRRRSRRSPRRGAVPRGPRRGRAGDRRRARRARRPRRGRGRPRPPRGRRATGARRCRRGSRPKPPMAAGSAPKSDTRASVRRVREVLHGDRLDDRGRDAVDEAGATQRALGRRDLRRVEVGQPRRLRERGRGRQVGAAAPTRARRSCRASRSPPTRTVRFIVSPVTSAEAMIVVPSISPVTISSRAAGAAGSVAQPEPEEHAVAQREHRDDARARGRARATGRARARPSGCRRAAASACDGRDGGPRRHGRPSAGTIDAVDHPDDAVGRAADGEVVGDDQQREPALAVEPAQQRGDLVGVRRCRGRPSARRPRRSPGR